MLLCSELNVILSQASRSAAVIFGRGLPKLATSTPYVAREDPQGRGAGSSLPPTQTPLPRDISAGTISSRSSHLSSGIGKSNWISNVWSNIATPPCEKNILYISLKVMMLLIVPSNFQIECFHITTGNFSGPSSSGSFKMPRYYKKVDRFGVMIIAAL